MAVERDHPADGPRTTLQFEAEVFEWRGPSPFYFVAAPPDAADALRALARAVSYGWGMVPATARIGGAAFTTALFPKDGTYLLPLRAAVRRAAGVTAGDAVAVELTVEAARS